MGLLSGITDALGLTDSGSGKDAAEAAGRVSAEQARKARAELKKGYRDSVGYLQSGYDSAEQLMYPTATPEGYVSTLQNLISGGGLDPLIAERRGNVMAELAAQGLTRSGAGITELAQIPLDVAMGIEGTAYGRGGNLANLYTGRGSALADLTTGYRKNRANIYTGQGQDQASAILAGQQAAAAGQSGMNNLIGRGLTAAGTYFGLKG